MAEPGELIDELIEVAAVLEAASRRFPRERTGPREPIPSHVRLLVLKRDGFSCDWCGARGRQQPFHLDHIVAWSAGGGDDTANLRTLCPDCNESRSNYRTDASYTRKLPCTPLCFPCAGWDHERSEFGDDTVNAFCGFGNHVSWVPLDGARWGCTLY